MNRLETERGICSDSRRYCFFWSCNGESLLQVNIINQSIGSLDLFIYELKICWKTYICITSTPALTTANRIASAIISVSFPVLLKIILLCSNTALRRISSVFSVAFGFSLAIYAYESHSHHLSCAQKKCAITRTQRASSRTSLLLL